MATTADWNSLKGIYRDRSDHSTAETRQRSRSLSPERDPSPERTPSPRTARHIASILGYSVEMDIDVKGSGEIQFETEIDMSVGIELSTTMEIDTDTDTLMDVDIDTGVTIFSFPASSIHSCFTPMRSLSPAKYYPLGQEVVNDDVEMEDFSEMAKPLKKPQSSLVPIEHRASIHLTKSLPESDDRETEEDPKDGLEVAANTALPGTDKKFATQAASESACTSQYQTAQVEELREIQTYAAKPQAATEEAIVPETDLTPRTSACEKSQCQFTPQTVTAIPQEAASALEVTIQDDTAETQSAEPKRRSVTLPEQNVGEDFEEYKGEWDVIFDINQASPSTTPIVLKRKRDANTDFAPDTKDLPAANVQILAVDEEEAEGPSGQDECPGQTTETDNADKDDGAASEEEQDSFLHNEGYAQAIMSYFLDVGLPEVAALVMFLGPIFNDEDRKDEAEDFASWLFIRWLNETGRDLVTEAYGEQSEMNADELMVLLWAWYEEHVFSEPHNYNFQVSLSENDSEALDENLRQALLN